jgi:hypothetical protein
MCEAGARIKIYHDFLLIVAGFLRINIHLPNSFDFELSIRDFTVFYMIVHDFECVVLSLPGFRPDPTN